jgi:hypothetical protein
MSEINVENIRTSWTKFSIVQAVQILSEGDLSQLNNSEIDAPIVKAVLGTNDLSKIPDYWKQVLTFNEGRALFAMTAAIFTHHSLIEDFAKIYSTKDYKGVFKNAKYSERSEDSN